MMLQRPCVEMGLLLSIVVHNRPATAAVRDVWVKAIKFFAFLGGSFEKTVFLKITPNSDVLCFEGHDPTVF